MENKNIELKPIPKVGEFYHFFDDGKTSPSRHYICKCERVVTSEEAKSIMVTVPDDECTQDNPIYNLVSLYDHWHNDEMPNHDWLYETETDYFVECSCPVYDDNNLWFVRTKNDGGWFSMDIQSWWQGGRLDVDGKIFENIIQEVKEHPQWYDVDRVIKAYNETTYEKK
jgi:hypothetical protein